MVWYKIQDNKELKSTVTPKRTIHGTAQHIPLHAVS